MKMWMGIAFGPNSVEVPCLLFESKEQGEAYLDTHLARTKHDLTWKLDYDGRFTYDNNPEIRACFTSYYGGCGSAGIIELREVPIATPFVSFDLD